MNILKLSAFQAGGKQLTRYSPTSYFARATCIVGCVYFGLVQTACALADELSQDQQSPARPSEHYAIHGQFTYVEQDTDSFSAPYAGANSLSPKQGRETTDLTLYLGAGLWHGAEIWLNPEVDQGFGLDNTLGVAGFPSGEAYKVGKKKPYFRLPRAFVRQTFSGPGDIEDVDAAANQLGGARAVDRWVLTIGKFGVTDIFDVNQYAHDPKNDFLNWAAVDAGSFDYAADAWGYTVGAALEWYQGAWTSRIGLFDLSNVPNSPHLDPGFHEFQLVAEVEKRFQIKNHTGKVMFTGFDSRGRMGLLNSAVNLAQATASAVDISAVRQYRSRLGASIDLEQQLSQDLGLFARVGKSAGNVEAYEFTDIDRSVEAGLSLKGTAWRRSRDTLSVAVMRNGISGDRERYLNAGGLGILVGDGKLPHPGAEKIIESYYSAAICPNAQVSIDYQWIGNPAYNRDRGPASVLAVKFHTQF